jgi:hypothetical protein
MSKLRLSKERLTELSTDELHRIAGAGADQQTLLECLSIKANCQSVRYCTTAMSCGCQPTWNCA